MPNPQTPDAVTREPEAVNIIHDLLVSCPDMRDHEELDVPVGDLRAIMQYLAAVEAERDEAKRGIAAALDEKEATKILTYRISELNAELATLREQLADLTRTNDRSNALWDVVNDISLCHQCQPELENALADADEAWDAKNPESPTPAREVGG